MELRNKTTGKRGVLALNNNEGEIEIVVLEPDMPLCGNSVLARYDSLAELNEEWEDYEPIEPIFDEKIRKGIRAWWDMQDNPFKSASVMSYGEKDLDGFYHWRIFGYIRDGKQKESTDLCFRTKKLYDYNESHDYTKEELCGEEE